MSGQTWFTPSSEGYATFAPAQQVPGRPAAAPASMEGVAPSTLNLREDGIGRLIATPLRDGAAATPPSPLFLPYATPWKTEFQMLMRFPVSGFGDRYFVCSASSVSSFHLLSAAHCIYNHDPLGDGSGRGAGFAAEVWAFAAKTDVVNPTDAGLWPLNQAWSDYPYGVAKATLMTTYNAWINSSDLNWDTSFITLDRRIGDHVGWMGREWGHTTTALNFDGYPMEAPYVPSNNPFQYPGFDANNVVSYTCCRISMSAYTYGGHSGGGVWRFDGTDRYLEGVNSTSNRAGSATATLFTATNNTDLVNLIASDGTTRPPVDRAQLIEYVFDTTSKGLVDTTVMRGSSFRLKLNAFNAGYISAGTVTADIYLTTDPQSVTSGTYIGTVGLGSLAAYTYTVQTQPVSVPTSVPAGNYYVGWVLFGTATTYFGDRREAIITNQVLGVSAPSTNANLSNLAISSGTLTPAFSSGTLNYTDAVANAVGSVTVTPTVAESHATVKVNGVTVASGAASGPIGLNVGANTISVVVTAQDGTTTKTYSIVVTRAAAPPTVATGAASATGASGATLNGTVSSNGAATTVTFQYGLTMSYGTTVTAAQSPLAGNASGTAVSAVIGGLGCATTYHYRAVGASSGGTTFGSDVTFTTAACSGGGFAPGTTTIVNNANATPAIVATLTVTCPASGALLIAGSGESAALSTNPGTAFIGIAYSIALNSYATDNANVVQSSALATFNGDANRDFLNVQRVDGCVPGAMSTYRLTAYRTTPDTAPGSFVWNGRLTASEPLSAPGAGFAAGTTALASNSNAAPTIVTTLVVTCPASGAILLGGSGESAALSTKAGTAFIGVAFSISRNSTATDNTNVVQSSALAFFNGDANREFLNVKRLDSCVPGTSATYRLTAYRTTPDTGAGSFVWNGRLTASTPLSAGSGFAVGTTTIGSSSNASPTIVSSLAVTCPASGAVLIGGSGESAALSTSAVPAFIGLAYSIARNSAATDNTNVVQSSALAVFNGDANRDFLNVQRVDTCTPGVVYNYSLTAYRTTPATGAGSFVWNGGLAAVALP